MRTFKLLDKAMILYSKTVCITTNVAKKYKMNYVKVLQNLAENIYLNLYRGNNLPIDEKLQLFLKVKEDIEIYNEFALQAKYDGCLSIQQKSELDEIINEVSRMLNAVISGLKS